MPMVRISLILPALPQVPAMVRRGHAVRYRGTLRNRHGTLRRQAADLGRGGSTTTAVELHGCLTGGGDNDDCCR